MGRMPGDGWVECDLGHRHWGTLGAAGLLALHQSAGKQWELLMQHRSPWTHSGDTWGLLGGAVSGAHDDAGSFIAENPVEAALREAHEEGGVPADGLTVLTEFVDDHGGWSYVTVIGFAAQRWHVAPMNGESLAVEWVELDAVDALPLHPGFGASWPTLRLLVASALDGGAV